MHARIAIRRIARSVSRALISATACAGLASIASADVIDTTWLGGAGSWHDPSKWSGGVVPNNSGPTTFRAVVPTGTVLGTGGISLDSLQLGSPASARLGSLYTSNGSEINGLLTMVSGYTTAAPLTGTGTLDMGVVPSTSWLQGTGILEIGSGLTVRLKRYHGRVTSGGDGPLINRGNIIGGDWDWNYAPYVSGGQIHNLGVIEASTGALHFSSTFTRADLGELRWSNGGTVSITGTLLNEGQTLQVDAAHAWGCMLGTVRGGTINIAADTRMVFGGEFTNSVTHLDDVVVNGPIRVQNDHLIIDKGVLTGNADVLVATRYIAREPRLISGTPTLTISSTAVIHGGDGGGGAGIGDGSGAVVNHGTIRAEYVIEPTASPGFTFSIVANSVFHDGTLRVDTDALLKVNAGHNVPTQLTFGDGGALQVGLCGVSGTGLLQVTGELDLLTSHDRLLLLTSWSSQPLVYYPIVTTTGGIIGEFDSTSPGFEVEYRNSHREIWARFVPEPAFGALAMLCFGRLVARSRGCPGRGVTRP